MNLTPPQLCHQLAGSPAVDGAEPASGFCYFCAGQVVRGVPLRTFLSSSFTDQNRVRCPAASHVCEACAHLSLWTSPPGRPPGKCPTCDGTCLVARIDKKGKAKECKIGDPCPKCNGAGVSVKGYNWRLFSHLYEEGWASPEQQAPGYLNVNKGDKPAIRAFIERHHQGRWFAAVADSGQKHILQLTRWNSGNDSSAGLVLLDELIVHVPADTSLIAKACHLLTSGATKDEIESGQYRFVTVERCETTIREFEAEHRGTRGSPWFALALWLAQRDEAAVEDRLKKEKEEKRARQATTREAAKPARRGGARNPGSVPKRAKRTPPARLLDAAGKQPVAGSGASQEHAPLRDQGPVRDAAPERGQLQLFGSD